jgi:hypothetical protein
MKYKRKSWFKSDNGNFVRLIVAILLVVFASANLKAQELFGTTNGTVQISSVWNDSAFIVKSKKLIVILNYQTAEFTLKLDLSTLETGIDSLDKKLKEADEEYIQYEGKMGIDFIQTQKHPVQNFDVDGYLSCAHHNQVIMGKGRLEHTFGDVYSCILSLKFHLQLKYLDINVDLPGLENDIYVDVIQSVLKRESE